MKIFVCLLILIIILLLLGLKTEYTKRIKAIKSEKEKDELLTKYIAENIDLHQELDEIKEEYSTQSNMAEEIKQIQANSRHLKHDMKNHTLVLLSYLEEDKIDEAKQYTSQILDNLNKIYTYVHVGNSLMNYIINNKLSLAKEYEIEVKAEIENLSFEYMDSVDFSAILNNMLDNAIEAAKNSYNKYIEIRITNQKGFDSILVKNSINNSVLQENPDLHSTKNNAEHGFGVKQIKNITAKYDGMTDIYEEDSNYGLLFSINVVYPC